MKTTLLLFLRWLPILALSLRQLLPVSIIEDRGGRRGVGKSPYTLPGWVSWQTSISRDSHLCWGFTSEGWPGHLIILSDSVLHLRLPSGQSKTRSCLPTDLISSHQSKASSSNGLCLSVSTDTQSLHFCLRLRRSSSLEAWLAIFLAGTCLSFCFLCLTFCLNPVRIHFYLLISQKFVPLYAQFTNNVSFIQPQRLTWSIIRMMQSFKSNQM